MSDEEQFDELERDVQLKIAEVKGYLDDLSRGVGETNRSRVDRCLIEIDKQVISFLFLDITLTTDFVDARFG